MFVLGSRSGSARWVGKEDDVGEPGSLLSDWIPPSLWLVRMGSSVRCVESGGGGDFLCDVEKESEGEIGSEKRSAPRGRGSGVSGLEGLVGGMAMERSGGGGEVESCTPKT